MQCSLGGRTKSPAALRSPGSPRPGSRSNISGSPRRSRNSPSTTGAPASTPWWRLRPSPRNRKGVPSSMYAVRSKLKTSRSPSRECSTALRLRSRLSVKSRLVSAGSWAGRPGLSTWARSRGASPSAARTGGASAPTQTASSAGARGMPRASRRGRRCSTRPCSGSVPVRDLGPARSSSIRQSRPCAAAVVRTCGTMRSQTAASSCAQLIRAMSMPARSNSVSRSGSSAASLGSVTMMRTSRSSRGGPSSARAWSRSRAGPLSKSHGACSGCGCAWAIMSRSRALTASREARTCGSISPSEDSPSAARSRCNARKSTARTPR